MRCSIKPGDRRYVNGYGFLSFAKIIDKNINSKYSQNLLDSAKKSVTVAIKIASRKTYSKNIRSNWRFNWK